MTHSLLMKNKFARFSAVRFIKMLLALCVLIYIALLASLKGFYKTNLEYLDHGAFNLGFRVTDIIVQNRKLVNAKTINDILKHSSFILANESNLSMQSINSQDNPKEVKIGTIEVKSESYPSDAAESRSVSIFGINLQSLIKDFMDTKLFKSVVIKKVYPNSLHIYINEKKPFGFWHNNGSIFLIDENGDILGTYKAIENYEMSVQGDLRKHFLNFYGLNANIYAYQLIRTLQGHDKILTDVLYAEYIENRRWNLVFKTGLKVKLPENLNAGVIVSLDNILKKLPKLVNAIDLRSKDRVYFKYQSKE